MWDRHRRAAMWKSYTSPLREICQTTKKLDYILYLTSTWLTPLLTESTLPDGHRYSLNKCVNRLKTWKSLKLEDWSSRSEYSSAHTPSLLKHQPPSLILFLTVRIALISSSELIPKRQWFSKTSSRWTEISPKPTSGKLRIRTCSPRLKEVPCLSSRSKWGNKTSRHLTGWALSLTKWCAPKEVQDVPHTREPPLPNMMQRQQRHNRAARENQTAWVVTGSNCPVTIISSLE